MQATVGRAAPVVFCRNGAGDQLSPRSGAGPDAKANILCKQSTARAKGEVPDPGEGGPGRGVLGQEASSLLSKLYGGGNDGLTYLESAAEARRSRKNGVLGGGALGVRRFCSRTLPMRCAARRGGQF